MGRLQEGYSVAEENFGNPFRCLTNWITSYRDLMRELPESVIGDLIGFSLRSTQEAVTAAEC